MRSENRLRAGAGLLLASAVLALSLTGCGREVRQGANDVNHKGMQQAKPFGANQTDNLQRIVPAPTSVPYQMNERANERMRSMSDGRMEMSQQAADAVASLDEVKSANVVLTNNNAYAAVVLHYGSTLTNVPQAQGQHSPVIGDVAPQVKQKIAEKIKAVDPSIRDVYVSANPDFVERMSVYAQDVRSGRPLSGFIREFSTMVERLFPTQASAPGATPAAPQPPNTMPNPHMGHPGK
ncbi:lipoprotein YhcN [Paenibacillus sp. J31TS4]|uniref:YhcN/YlaJ family sporulation lipoprotein n=1 Tax=Paenibacillus sp. J31TS4 TaxID=2807195 RepID=UPI001B08632E|nr:YhcN/YlaJ family sporulation lipoprotein [Paenibacillus sp. J31TS4]GIP39141.1 lipoprotein YhcN [Paenibacillus sp. J31TS4]